MKKFFGVGIVVILLVCAGWYYTRIQEKSVATVYTGFIEQNITKAMSQSNGKIIEVHVEEGQQIAKGDLVAITDQTDLLFQKEKIISEIAIKQNQLDNLIEGADANDYKQLTLQQESLKLKIALATDNLELKQSQLEDAKVLLQSNAIDADQVENLELVYQQAKTDLNVLRKEYEKATLAYDDLVDGVDQHTIEIARADLNLSEISLKNIESKIEETYILAPSDGIVRNVYYNENEVVSMGAIVADLLENDSLYVQFYVDEANFWRVKLGNNIKLTLDGSGEIILAKISELSNYAQFTPKNISTKADRQSLVFKVKANLEDRDQLHSGMMVDVEIEEGATE